MNIGIVGLGLIGGSYAKALRSIKGIQTFGTDILITNVEKALSSGDISQELTDDLLKDCDITIIALYPSDTMQYLSEKAPQFKKGSIVIDCCGIKESICNFAAPLSKEHGFTFIGSDPFAGISESGYASSSATLFVNKELVLTPYPEESEEIILKISTFLMRLGFSDVKQMSPAEHDRIIALTSQLTHIISNALIQNPTAMSKNHLLSGSFRDLTKRAALNEQMWSEVFIGNKENLVKELDVFIDNLKKYRKSIINESDTELEHILNTGKKAKKKLEKNVISISASKNYDIIVNHNILKNTGNLVAKLFVPGKVLIVTDDIVAGLYAEQVTHSLKEAGFTVFQYTFSHGESAKNFSTLIEILEYLSQQQFTRSDLIIALGGGVTGDLTGFAADTYLRGTPFIQIPTTFLAAIDSSVGGKTAVNLESGKNLAGAFNQPNLVICDYDTIMTLSDDEFAAGIAEAVKYGVLIDEKLFHLLHTSNAREHLEWIIKRCILIKRDYVMADEYDTGSRQFLNLGHTLAHAIEKKSNYTINHGHAVAIGLVAIAKAAFHYGLTDIDCSSIIRETLQKYKLKTECPYPIHELCQIILNDKKRSGMTLTVVIPKKIGECFLYKMPIEEIEPFFSKGI